MSGVDYEWIALSNTTPGAPMASLNSSIVLIALPAIFRGIGLDPLDPAEIGYLGPLGSRSREGAGLEREAVSGRRRKPEAE